MFKRTFILSLTTAALAGATGIAALPGMAQAGQKTPALVISSDPLPAELRNRIYSKPAPAQPITASDVAGTSYYGDSNKTVVGHKVDDLRGELFALQGKVSDLSESLARLENSGQNLAAEYYASVATINTQLQTGTTPGNPRLVERLSVARNNLEKLSANITALNDLAMDVSNAATMSSFLLESARAAYNLSGAVEEDHTRLAQLEDSVNSTVVLIDRLLNNVNDDITRTSAYLGTERENLRTLALGISTGDLFGKSLSNRPFSSAQLASFAGEPAPAAAPAYAAAPMPESAAYAPAPAARAPGALAGGARPLVKIRFDRADVAYEQPVYMAVNEALSRYPNARFELVAVHPNTGNAAQVAIESTRARRNAEKVLRSLTQMGLTMDRVDLSYAPSAEAATNEVHLYVR